MFGFFKRLNARRNAVAQDIVRLIEEEERKSCALSDEELLSLSDEELVANVWVRIKRFAAGFDTERRALDNMDEAQKTFYIVQCFALRIEAEGLCAYFANAGRDMALFLSDALERVGAMEQKNLFEDFLHDHKIATASLSDFAVESSKEFKRMERKYPFDEFNSAFYALPPMTECLAAYLRENITSF